MGDAWDKALWPITVAGSIGVIMLFMGVLARALGGPAGLAGEVVEYVGLALMIASAAAIAAVAAWPSRR